MCDHEDYPCCGCDPDDYGPQAGDECPACGDSRCYGECRDRILEEQERSDFAQDNWLDNSWEKSFESPFDME